MAKNNKQTILVVEDEVSLLGALAEKLGHEGFFVLKARNGQEGLEVALKEHPDLILLDIIMPVMDGTTMFKELRKNSWGKKAKVVLLTNLDDSEKMAESILLGAYGYLVKSNWKLKDVIVKVRDVLAK